VSAESISSTIKISHPDIDNFFRTSGHNLHWRLTHSHQIQTSLIAAALIALSPSSPE
jgi:hypothetical protein